MHTCLRSRLERIPRLPRHPVIFGKGWGVTATGLPPVYSSEPSAPTSGQKEASTSIPALDRMVQELHYPSRAMPVPGWTPLWPSLVKSIHSFSWSLRHQLRKTKVKVYEVITLTVDTELDRDGRERRRQDYRGIHPPDEAEASLSGLAKDEFEIDVRQAQGLRTATRQEVEQIFQRMNENW
jgi:hypothetical protein